MYNIIDKTMEGFSSDTKFIHMYTHEESISRSQKINNQS